MGGGGGDSLEELTGGCVGMSPFKNGMTRYGRW